MTGLSGAALRHAAQRLQQEVGVVVHRADALVGEELGEEPHHHLAVLEHVRHPGWRAQVVLEHVVLAVRMPHEVHSGDVRVDAAGNIDAHHLAAELRVVLDLLRGDLAGLDDLLAVVDVVQEPVQRLDALLEPPREQLPLVARYDVRDDVERDQPLGSGRFSIDGEGDADAVEQEVGRMAVLRDALGRRVGEPLGERLVVLSHRAVAVEHLVEALDERLALALRLGLGLGHVGSRITQAACRNGNGKETGFRFGPEAGKIRAGSTRAAPPPGDR
jgi:hypothetical protein